MRRTVALLLMLSLAGCATGFDRGALRQQLAGEAREVTDADIRRALELRPQLALPFRLGVVFNDRNAWASRWEMKDKAALLSVVGSLEADGIVSEAFVISDSVIPGRDLRDSKWSAAESGLKAIRLAAARHGADAVLVVTGASQVDRYINPFALLNLTIVGGYLVPGSHRGALFMITAAMWDVRNEYLYLTVEAEGVGKSIGPTFVIEDGWAIAPAKDKAIVEFRDDLVRRMRSLRGS